MGPSLAASSACIVLVTPSLVAVEALVREGSEMHVCTNALSSHTTFALGEGLMGVTDCLPRLVDQRMYR